MALRVGHPTLPEARERLDNMGASSRGGIRRTNDWGLDDSDGIVVAVGSVSYSI
jgi:hypothetical protein